MNPEMCISLAAEACGVTPADVTSRFRFRPMVKARHLACWLMRRGLGLKLDSIATAVGRKDHSSVYHSLWRAEERREQDAEFREIGDLLLFRVRVSKIAHNHKILNEIRAEI